jgi:hypothetical protein
MLLKHSSSGIELQKHWVISVTFPHSWFSKILFYIAFRRSWDKTNWMKPSFQKLNQDNRSFLGKIHIGSCGRSPPFSFWIELNTVLPVCTYSVLLSSVAFVYCARPHCRCFIRSVIKCIVHQNCVISMFLLYIRYLLRTPH